MSAQLDLPHLAAERRGRRDEDDVGSVQREATRALREVAVVADRHSDLDAEVGVPDGIAEVARAEVELLVALDPVDVDERDHVLAVQPDDLARAVEEGGRVVELALLHLLVEGEDDVRVRVPRRLRDLRRRRASDAARRTP